MVIRTKYPTGLNLDKKWVSYAMAGSAILGLPLLTQAQTITATPGTPASLNVHFDDLSVTDFTINAEFESFNNGPLSPTVFVNSGLPTTSFLGTGSPLYPIAFASVADVALGSLGPTTTNGKLLKLNQSPIKTGNWQNNGDAWLGVVFDISGQQYLGWADIAVALNSDTASATLGATGFEVLAPEPSSIALLALGATGLAVLRKRRNTVN